MSSFANIVSLILLTTAALSYAITHGVPEVDYKHKCVIAISAMDTDYANGLAVNCTIAEWVGEGPITAKKYPWLHMPDHSVVFGLPNAGKASLDCCDGDIEQQTLTGKTAVICDRGRCGFWEKATNAEKAGASLVVVLQTKGKSYRQRMAQGHGRTLQHTSLPAVLVPWQSDIAFLLAAAAAFKEDGATALTLSATGDGNVDDHADGPKAVAAISAAEAEMAPVVAHHAELRAGLDLGQLVREKQAPAPSLFDVIKRAQMDATKHSAGYGKGGSGFPDPYRALRLVAAGVRAKSDAGVRAAGVAAIVRLESTSSPETVSWWLKDILKVNAKDARMLRHLSKRLSGDDADALRRRADSLEREL